ncbi:MAG: serpin family protein, partial [Pseudomonadota bacterium]
GLGGLLAEGVLENMSSDSSLRLAKILQKAVFKIDEKGGEGAAVSVGGAVATSIGAPKPVTNLFINGEFAYSVVDNETGAVLFQGVVGDPTESK